MNLGEMLRQVGGRMGLIHVASIDEAKATGPKTVKVTTRTISMKDLATEVCQAEVQALAQMPAEMSVAFEDLFQAAGIKPPTHGWTIERLKTLLKTDQFRSLDRESVQKALLGMLSTEKVLVEEIVKDAVARDQAIDAYELHVRRKMQARGEARQRKIADLRAQIKSLEKDITRQDAEDGADRQEWRAWLKRKVECEEGMAWALGYLLDKPMVSITKPEE